MPTDLNSLSERMTRLSRKFLTKAQQLEVDVAKETHRLLVLNTPVDKGVARSNWLITVGFETDAVIAAHFPGQHLGLSETANAQATIEAGLNVLISALTKEGEQQIFIQNNVPYIEKLNAGSSSQAPGLFVEMAIQQGLEIVRKRFLLQD